MPQVNQKNRGEVAPEKVQVNWRILKDVYEALQKDAETRGFSSPPALLNHMLTLHYFGKSTLRRQGSR